MVALTLGACVRAAPKTVYYQAAPAPITAKPAPTWTVSQTPPKPAVVQAARRASVTMARLAPAPSNPVVRSEPATAPMLVRAVAERPTMAPTMIASKTARSGKQRDNTGWTTVTVRKGDTLYGIARRTRVPLGRLIDVNKLRKPYRIAPGQKLRLSPLAVHTVRRGETLYSIARRYGADLQQLAKLNGIGRPFTLSVGKRLKVPPATRQKAAAALRPSPKSRPLPKRAGKFNWPVIGRVISRFGAKQGGLRNDGINIAVKPGTGIRAAENGVVAYAGNELPGFGNLLLIRHAGGFTTAYAHSARILVKRGQRVRRGQVIAKAGSTGNVARTQLHFEIRRGTQAFDPIKFLGKPALAALPQRVSRAASSGGRPGPG